MKGGNKIYEKTQNWDFIKGKWLENRGKETEFC